MTKKNMERFTYPLTIKKRSIPNAYDRRRVKMEEQLIPFQSLSSDGDVINLGSDDFFKSIGQNPIITRSRLNEVNLSGKQLDALILIDCDATALIAEGVIINTLILIRTLIQEANFQDAQIAKAILFDVTATNTHFRKAALMQSWLQGDFEKSVFDEADMSEAVLEGNFQGVSFQKASLVDCWLSNSDIQYSTFLEAEVKGITLDLVRPGVNAVVLPDGSFYHYSTNTFDKFHGR